METKFSNNKTIINLLLIMLLFSSCKTVVLPTYYYGTFKFKQKSDEVFLKPDFISFLKINPSPRIVLRVPNKQNSIVEEEIYKNRSQYFAIEKILLGNFFRVIDRSIFEKKFIKDTSFKSTADFILEMIDYKNVTYYTDKVIPEGNKDDKEISFPKYFYFVGAEVSFKITDLNSGEIVATFVLNYTPCTKGCRLKYNSNGEILEELSGDKKMRKKLGYEYTESDDNYDMFIDLTTRLVDILRKASNENK